MDKQKIRETIWNKMEQMNIAAFPRPVYGRIPNFKGSERAAFLLSNLEEFKKASLIKVNPDSPQRKVREIALSMGKKVIVPTPRLRGDFFLLDPKKVNPREASSISGFTKLGERVDIFSLDKIDAVIVGSVAVTRKGDRVGKGEGYSELEYAMLRELEKVDDSTPVITTLHPIQIVQSIPSMPYDVPVNILVTPEEVIRAPPREKPKGIMIEYLEKEKIEKTPFLKEFLMKYHEKDLKEN
ncbi:5-formyltetrahydrofolate cyclo-ligase [Acidianus sp. RZ1]|uniref:5-formyltetrahydrofolate cyclo-ligase n=1 Tax=Acidianus sp. RZ1 TaxID=1540082 RepID=UPI001491E7A2|nr:5-formyltetrahydrofolate cyclo-ligase [Acidianus sp. RZ1]NON61598.1 5-formyltetrahydrofolate cyclo-ligase [Acidianus sp. RZ1]